MKNNEHESLELQYSEEFEIEKKYNKTWSNIRFNKIGQIKELIQQVVALFKPYLFYTKLYQLFKKMRVISIFYTLHDLIEITTTFNKNPENTFRTKRVIDNLYELIIFNGLFCTRKDNKGFKFSL